ncbi:MAG: hypothetical protein V3R98_02705, partial [Alphaproteobacteria bacterium]
MREARHRKIPPISLAASALIVPILLAAAGPVWADIRAWDHGDFGRLVFDWDIPADYRIRRDDRRIIVDFDRPIDGPLAPATNRLNGYIEEARIIGDGSQLLLVLEPWVGVADFVNDHAIVFDLRRAGDAPDAASRPPTAPDIATDPSPAPVIRVRGGEHADFSRLVFDWPDAVPYRVDHHGERVVVEFDASADADLTRVVVRDLGRVDSVAQSSPGGALEVVVTVPPGARVRHFLNGPKVVLDVLDGGAMAAAGRLGTPPPVPPHRPTTAAGPPPAAGVAPREPIALIRPTPVPEKFGEADEHDAAAPAADPAAMREPAPQPVAVFDPGTPTRLAAFHRDDALWLVFVADRRLDADALVAQADGAFGPADVVRAEGGVALRFTPGRGRAVVDRDDTAWTVTLRDDFEAPARTLVVEGQPDFPPGARLLVRGGGAGSLVRLTDPAVGDMLIVAPVEQPGTGLPDGQRYAQVWLLPTVQGAVARPLTETVAMRIAGDGIEITDDDGLQLSSSVDTAIAMIAFHPAAPTSAAFRPPQDPIDRLLDIAAWRGPDDRFIEQRQDLQRGLADARDSRRDLARLELARFYFANGHAQEAIGLLDLVEENQPAAAEREGFAALRGAARVMAGDLAGAAADLDHPALADSREAALWRGGIAAQAGDWPGAAAAFDEAGWMIEEYPSPFAEAFALWAAETALQQGEFVTAEGHLGRLGERTDGRSDRWDSTNFLRGEIARRSGHTTAAAVAYQRAAAGHDRLYRTLAEGALIDMDLANGAIGWERAAAQMEALRFAWRGDDLEFDLLDRLGGLYWDAGRYRRALTAWREAVNNFGDTETGAALAERLNGRFVELYSSGRADALSPLAAVSLYNDFRDLTPAGPVGDGILLGLAERLVEIDLLDQAGDVLEDLVDSRLSGAERVAAGTRLAAIRLLDGASQAALDALAASSMTGPADDDSEMAVERRLLRARALSALGHEEAALVLLAGDQSRLADAARAEIAWRREDWPLAADALAGLAGDPPESGAAVSTEQAQLVLNLGIALALADDPAGLARLARTYGPAMARSPYDNTFAVLTRSPGNVPPLADLVTVR